MQEPKIKNLPLGLSDFGEVITNNCVYVDKTRFIHQLITNGKYYFLSRPRRFGKSLLISTLHAIFAGKKELFKNLWIYSSDYDWKEHPIIHIDFSEPNQLSVHELELWIEDTLIEQAADYDIDLSKQRTITGKFSHFIKQLAQRDRVIVLIDEYDKPILDHITEPKEAIEQRKLLKKLYSVLKGKDAYLRFVFLTGVSKFSKTSIFSGINNLSDITLDERYATMLGYTPEEIQHYFSDRLEQVALHQKQTFDQVKQQLTTFYDGYRFFEYAKRVFNPYSVLRCLDTKKFSDYWFETGTPTFLIKLLQKNLYDLESVTNPVLNAGSLGSFEPDNIPLSSLLLQTGYLTIQDYDKITSNYTLGIPNKEVYNGLTLQLVDAYTLLPPDTSIQYAQTITQALMVGNIKQLQEKLQEFFNRAPYIVQVQSESQLRFVLYSIFALIGVAVDPEVMTSCGRADLIMNFPKLVYVVELKYNQTASGAIEQIEEKQYYTKFKDAGKHITLLGINFDSATKTISVLSKTLN